MSAAERRPGARTSGRLLPGLVLATALAVAFTLAPALAAATPATPAATPAGHPTAALRPFSAQVWQRLRKAPGAGRVVVFTSTDCVYCSAEVDRIAASLRHQAAPRPRIAVVVMDGTEGARALLADGHYRAADEIYAFDGNETVLRYAIDPAWRGETPYLALLPRQGAPWFVLGHATDADLLKLAGGGPR